MKCFPFILERCLIWDDHVNHFYFLTYVFNYLTMASSMLNLSSWKIISFYPSNTYQKGAFNTQCIHSSQSLTTLSEVSNGYCCFLILKIRKSCLGEELWELTGSSSGLIGNLPQCYYLVSSADIFHPQTY